MEIMQEEAATFGIEINWSKTKIQAVGAQHYPSVVHVAGNELEVVGHFTYLEVQISNDQATKRWDGVLQWPETAFGPYSPGVRAFEWRRR